MSRDEKNKESVLNFIFTILIILSIRWALFEPYVIPSGSMIPSLLIHDHIVVKKFSNGLRWPFSDKWIYGPIAPERGKIIVFQHPNENYFMVKRVIGLPGDHIKLNLKGQLFVNNEMVDEELSSLDDPSYYSVSEESAGRASSQVDVLKHKFGESNFRTMRYKGAFRGPEHFEVPEGHLFMMGDNRDNSQDSRFWGTLPMEMIMGEASFVWLSCEKTLSAIPQLCNPTQLRWDRFFHQL